MREAVIVDAVRTPLGRGKPTGALHPVHAVDLAARPLRALVERTGIDPADVEDVIMGCVSQVGEQGISAEIIAERWKLSRAALDEFSLGSHRKAAEAARRGWFANEIVPVEIRREDGSREYFKSFGMAITCSACRTAYRPRPRGVARRGSPPRPQSRPRNDRRSRIRRLWACQSRGTAFRW